MENAGFARCVKTNFKPCSCYAFFMNAVAQFEIGSGKNFVYCLMDDRSMKAAIIDPQKDLTKPLAMLKQEGFELELILLTHSHLDHTIGVAPLLKLKPNLKIFVGKKDIFRLPDEIANHQNLNVLHGDEILHVGNLEVQAIATPGHTAGAISYFIRAQDHISTPQLFTGDTVFIRDCGRTDFEDGSNEDMWASLQKIRKLPPETEVWVGHHYAPESSTTLEKELRTSPPFLAATPRVLADLP